MRHTKRPPNERRFKCDQCERMFFTRKDVKRHLVVHTGVRNYACPFCQQRFGRKDHLVRHAKKSHQKDTRNSVTNIGPVSNVMRRISFGHSPHSPTSLSPIEVSSRGCSSIENVNTSPSHFSSPNTSMDPSLTLLTNSGNLNNNSEYPGNTNPMTINEGYCSASMITRPQICDNSLYNGSNYFSLGQTTPSIMSQAYLSNCFGHISMNSNALHNQNALPVSDQNNPVTLLNSVSNYSMDSVANPLPHFNQVFQ